MGPKVLPNRLRVLRAERHMTQLTLARKARCHQSRLSHLENGLDTATDDELARLAKVLRVPVADLFQVTPKGGV